MSRLVCVLICIISTTNLVISMYYVVGFDICVCMYLQGSGGGMATGPVVPQEHPGRPVPERQRRRRRRRQVDVAAGVGEGEHGRRAVPAQGGAEDVRQLPGAVQGAPEDVQLLHHRYVLTYT